MVRFFVVRPVSFLDVENGEELSLQEYVPRALDLILNDAPRRHETGRLLSYNTKDASNRVADSWPARHFNQAEVICPAICNNLISNQQSILNRRPGNPEFQGRINRRHNSLLARSVGSLEKSQSESIGGVNTIIEFFANDNAAPQIQPLALRPSLIPDQPGTGIDFSQLPLRRLHLRTSFIRSLESDLVRILQASVSHEGAAYSDELIRTIDDHTIYLPFHRRTLFGRSDVFGQLTPLCRSQLRDALESGHIVIRTIDEMPSVALGGRISLVPMVQQLRETVEPEVFEAAQFSLNQLQIVAEALDQAQLEFPQELNGLDPHFIPDLVVNRFELVESRINYRQNHAGTSGLHTQEEEHQSRVEQALQNIEQNVESLAQRLDEVNNPVPSSTARPLPRRQRQHTTTRLPTRKINGFLGVHYNRSTFCVSLRAGLQTPLRRPRAFCGFHLDLGSVSKSKPQGLGVHAGLKSEGFPINGHYEIGVNPGQAGKKYSVDQRLSLPFQTPLTSNWPVDTSLTLGFVDASSQLSLSSLPFVGVTSPSATYYAGVECKLKPHRPTVGDLGQSFTFPWRKPATRGARKMASPFSTRQSIQGVEPLGPRSLPTQPTSMSHMAPPSPFIVSCVLFIVFVLRLARLLWSIISDGHDDSKKDLKLLS